jgi:hypothetical protein
MEKIAEITTQDSIEGDAFELIIKCKELSNLIDISNVILDNTTIDEKEMLVDIIETMRKIKIDIIEEIPIPKARA